MTKRWISTLGGLGLAFLTFGASHAATVSCPGTLTDTLTRQVTVTGALSGGECYYQPGNFAGDDVSAYLGSSAVLIDKDVAPNEGAEGSLLYTITPDTNGGAGTWGMGSNLWLTNDEIFLGFHFGNGSGDPDSFLVELDPGTLSGTWALLPTELVNGLSNIYLFGRGDGGGGGGGSVPLPGTVALLGLGLLAAGFARRGKA